MPFWAFGPRPIDSFKSRMERARADGFHTGSSEAKLFKLAVGGVFERYQAFDWLNTTVEDGRARLEEQHAMEREIEAWDMCCRIAFLVELT
jgi:hypothetical protein